MITTSSLVFTHLLITSLSSIVSSKSFSIYLVSFLFLPESVLGTGFRIGDSEREPRKDKKEVLQIRYKEI